MSFSVPCECGNALTVTAADAGTERRCACGRVVTIPRLGELRRQSGQGEFETGMIDTINRMIRNGKLPAGDRCLICGRPTSDTLDVHVQCETTWNQNNPNDGGFLRYLIAFLSLGWLFFCFFWPKIRKPPPKECGRDRSIDIPLRICPEHQPQLCSTSHAAELRSHLLTISVYRQLLEEFPSAMISARATAKLND